MLTDTLLRISAYCISTVVKLLLMSLRVEKVGESINESGIVAFLHGEQLALLCHRPLTFPMVTAVSLSKDGNLQAHIMKHFQINSVRGSTSRGAVKLLRALLQWFHIEHGIILLAIDGPRGPWGKVSPGAHYLSQKLDVPLWFCRVEFEWSISLKSWDRFVLPLPFSKIKILTYRCQQADHIERLIGTE